MGIDSEFMDDLALNLGNVRYNYLVIKMKQLNEEIENTKDEETKACLKDYKQDLWEIAHRLGQLLDKLSLDKEVDPVVSEKMRAYLARMAQATNEGT